MALYKVVLHIVIRYFKSKRVYLCKGIKRRGKKKSSEYYFPVKGRDSIYECQMVLDGQC